MARASRVLAVLAAAALVPANADLAFTGYNPEHPTEPFDAASQMVSKLLVGTDSIRREDGWRQGFCNCIENGYIAGWYQYAPAMYVVDTCSHEKGFIMRTGHLQDRHTEPLEGMMSCDVLKLISYCFSHHAPEAIAHWNNTCANAHYTVPKCDVNCNAATHIAGGSGGVFAAFLVAVATLFARAA
uniref:Uncharacterized protein n=1 Tax=Strombidinopsis acuminata TaxID=141414 RepID=A0A7S3SUL8_9SPIT